MGFEVNMKAKRVGSDAPAIPVRALFRKVTRKYDGRHATVCEIRGEGGIIYGRGVARLGKSDVGRYDFFVGCRIALDRALFHASHVLQSKLVSALRRTLQIEVALAANEEENLRHGAALRASIEQRAALLYAKARISGRTIRDLMEEDCAVQTAHSAAVRFLRGSGNVKPRGIFGELPLKPEAYKSSAPPAAGPSGPFVRPSGPSVVIPFGAVDDSVLPPISVIEAPPAECAECKGDPACCQKHGGL